MYPSEIPDAVATPTEQAILNETCLPLLVAKYRKYLAQRLSICGLCGNFSKFCSASAIFVLLILFGFWFGQDEPILRLFSNFALALRLEFLFLSVIVAQLSMSKYEWNSSDIHTINEPLYFHVFPYFLRHS